MTGPGPDQHEHGAPFDGDAELARAIAEHVRFEFDDAAYLLGALAAEEREAFERHLRGCPVCQDRIAEFGDVPEVLARADISAWEPEPPPDTLLPRLLRQVAASRRRRARRLGALAAVAACLLALLAAGGVLGWQRAHQPHTLTMQPVGPNTDGVHATVRLAGSRSGTRVTLVCGFP
ncbi:MAG: hypothetical protein QOE53_1019, partial [Pseudonocardiales bacterium]|nr:hypothetical protein [Pseudonocardiales bacterium]